MAEKNKFQNMTFVVTGKGSLRYNRKEYFTGDRFVPVNLSLKEIFTLYQSGEIMPVEQAERIAAAKAESAKIMKDLEADLKKELKRIEDEMKEKMEQAKANN
jgi:hypothetical protein